jgi:hypothetical protein
MMPLAEARGYGSPVIVEEDATLRVCSPSAQIPEVSRVKVDRSGATSSIRISLGASIFALWSLIVGGIVLMLTGRQGVAVGVAISTGLVAAPQFTTLVLGPRQEHQQHGGILTLLRALFVLMTVVYGFCKILSFMLIVMAELGSSMFLARLSDLFERIAEFFEDKLDL